jgi:hypothetical protein
MNVESAGGSLLDHLSNHPIIASVTSITSLLMGTTTGLVHFGVLPLPPVLLPLAPYSKAFFIFFVVVFLVGVLMVACSIAKMIAKKEAPQHPASTELGKPSKVVGTDGPPRGVGNEEPSHWMPIEIDEPYEDPFGEYLEFLRKITDGISNPTPMQLVENIRAELPGRTDAQIVAFLQGFPSAKVWTTLPSELLFPLRIVTMTARGSIFIPNPKEENSTRQILKPVFFENDPNCEEKIVVTYDPFREISSAVVYMPVDEIPLRNYAASQLAQYFSGKHKINNCSVEIHDSYLGNANAMASPLIGDREFPVDELMQIKISKAPDDVQNHFKCAAAFSYFKSGDFCYFGEGNRLGTHMIDRIPCWTDEQMGKFIRQLIWIRIFDEITADDIHTTNNGVMINKDLMPVKIKCHNAFQWTPDITFYHTSHLIDSEMFDFLTHLNLLKMKSYLKDLRILSEGAIFALIERTKKLIQHAESLEKSDAIVASDVWEKEPWKLAGPIITSVFFNYERTNEIEQRHKSFCDNLRNLNDSSESVRNLILYMESLS